MLGKLLADSGGADQVVDTILARSGPRRLPWAMALVAAIVGLPMFFEIGLVILVPVILLVARRGNVSVRRVGIPALAGNVSVLHGLVPPHPGPLIAIAHLVAVPTVIVAGPVFGSVISKRITPTPPEGLLQELTQEPIGDRRPSFAATLGTILLTVVLMLVRAVVDVVEDKHKQVLIRRIFDFVGDPFVALLIGVLVAMVTLGTRVGVDRQTLSRTLGASLGPIAGILLIVAGGGGFKQVLVDVGLGDVIKHLVTGTVTTVTASDIVAPLASSLDSPHVALLALAVGAGSLFFSHVNDAGFWLVKEYFGMSVGETIRSWSVWRRSSASWPLCSSSCWASWSSPPRCAEDRTAEGP